jgi:hypothetical protein
MENVLHLRKKGKKKEKPFEEFVSNFRLNFTYMTGKVEEFQTRQNNYVKTDVRQNVTETFRFVQMVVGDSNGN